MEKINDFLANIRNLFQWFWPFFIFLTVLFSVKPLLLKDIDLIELLKVLIWPVTVLIILYFFKKVVTYLFFSMDEFNFFGAKGTLKNVEEVMREEIDKRFLDEKGGQKRKEKMRKLSLEIENRKMEIDAAKGSSEKNHALAKQIFSKWKKSEEIYQKMVSDLEDENKRLREQTSVSASASVNSTPLENKVSDLGTGEEIKDMTPGSPI